MWYIPVSIFTKKISAYWLTQSPKPGFDSGKPAILRMASTDFSYFEICFFLHVFIMMFLYLF